MDMMKMMKQVAEMKKIQKQLASKKVEFSSAGGQVTVKMTCDMKPQSITISPELIQSGNMKKIEGAILDAFKGILNEAQMAAANDMKSLTAGMGLPF
ncbi:MAG: YbaB/EbfC family nucleoid-associated protein [Verrucomicrobia bacterium]|nr:YbaB/EbfC family nucleoid-associated protein [Verrucomicrobiota bacterium]